jgi:hypothetical protein
MAIFPRDRRDLTPEEFLAMCAKYNIECRRIGERIRFYDEFTTRDRAGEIVMPSEVVHWVMVVYLYEGEPKLHFIGSTKDEGVVGLAWTPSGRRWKKDTKEWQRRVNPQLPRRFAKRVGRHA